MTLILHVVTLHPFLFAVSAQCSLLVSPCVTVLVCDLWIWGGVPVPEPVILTVQLLD